MPIIEFMSPIWHLSCRETRQIALIDGEGFGGAAKFCWCCCPMVQPKCIRISIWSSTTAQAPSSQSLDWYFLSHIQVVLYCGSNEPECFVCPCSFLREKLLWIQVPLRPVEWWWGLCIYAGGVSYHVRLPERGGSLHCPSSSTVSLRDLQIVLGFIFIILALPIDPSFSDGLNSLHYPLSWCKACMEQSCICEFLLKLTWICPGSLEIVYQSVFTMWVTNMMQIFDYTFGSKSPFVTAVIPVLSILTIVIPYICQSPSSFPVLL